MTNEEIKRYLALPEEFLKKGLVYEMGRCLIVTPNAFAHEPHVRDVDQVFEDIAIASMLVGLRKRGCDPELTYAGVSLVGCNFFDDDSGEIVRVDGESDLLALLAACEHVAKVVQP